MTWIKICGITNIEDAKTAVEAGADALGFVFYEKSPRNVPRETVHTIIREIPAHIEKIGVFVGNNPDHLPELARSVGLTGSQRQFAPHLGSVNETIVPGVNCFPIGFKSYTSIPANWFIESEEFADRFISRAARAGITQTHETGDTFLDFFGTLFLDSGTLQQPGGTGVAFDWQRAAPIVERIKQVVRVVVAGGLNPTNVTDAIDILNPWGVDVSSGVEAKPGKKDPEKVKAFITAVRQTERLA
jgi:phosphoribosylanthranilate isomerase